MTIRGELKEFFRTYQRTVRRETERPEGLVDHRDSRDRGGGDYIRVLPAAHSSTGFATCPLSP
jgi:hypothetical protein